MGHRINFFFAIFFILMKPWFNMDPSLDVARFGIITAIESIGMILASIILINIKISPKNRAKIMLSALLL